MLATAPFDRPAVSAALQIPQRGSCRNRRRESPTSTYEAEKLAPRSPLHTLVE
jgi:hypothetical protein